MLHPFCLRCIPARYVIPPDFVSANPLALMETINQYSTFWGMTYRLLLWRGRTGHDRKVLQQSDKDEEVLLQMKIVKGKLQISLLPREVCDLGFSLSPPSHSWINFQLDRAKSTLGPGTKFRASKVIQDNAVKNESPEGLYFHYEPPPNKEQVCFSVEEPWNKDLQWCREDKEASQCGVVRFHIQSAKLAPLASSFLLLAWSTGPQYLRMSASLQ